MLKKKGNINYFTSDTKVIFLNKCFVLRLQESFNQAKYLTEKCFTRAFHGKVDSFNDSHTHIDLDRL